MNLKTCYEELFKKLGLLGCKFLVRRGGSSSH